MEDKVNKLSLSILVLLFMLSCRESSISEQKAEVKYIKIKSYSEYASLSDNEKIDYFNSIQGPEKFNLLKEILINSDVILPPASNLDFKEKTLIIETAESPGEGPKSPGAGRFELTYQITDSSISFQHKIKVDSCEIMDGEVWKDPVMEVGVDNSVGVDFRSSTIQGRKGKGAYVLIKSYLRKNKN